MKRLHHKDHPAFLLPRSVGRKTTPRLKASQPENTTLAEACAWLDAIGVEWWHLPYWLTELAFGVETKSDNPHMREAAADVRGFPDLLLMFRGHFLAVELKTEVGKMSRNQRQWMARIGTQVLRTLPEFQIAVFAWKASIEKPMQVRKGAPK